MEKNYLRLVKNGETFQDEDQLGPPPINPQRFKSFLGGGRTVLRHLLFAVLMFVRIPVVFISRIVVGPLLFGAIVWGFIAGWNSTATLSLAGASLIFFLTGFAFDTLVLALAPEGYILEL